MDIETLVNKVHDLESEIKVLKKALSNQNKKSSEMDERITAFLDAIREQKKELDHMNSIVGSLGQFDSAISQMRVDFTKKLDEYEKRRKSEEKNRNDLWREETRNLSQAIEQAKQDITRDTTLKMKTQLDELSMMIGRFKEIELSYEKRVKEDDEIKASFNALKQEGNQQKKKFDSYSRDLEGMKKRQDEIRDKQEIILNDLRTNDTRLSEIINTEVERRQVYLNFVEQQNLAQKDRERIWREWQQHFDGITSQADRLIPELQNQHIEVTKNRNTLEEITQRFERRLNEISELYRLLDEKLRNEWTIYKSDTEKKWSNLSIVFDEKQGSFADQFNKLKERMLAVEDSTHDIQEVLMLMSKEIQTGMQSLMNMVNGWMEAFGELKPSR